MAKDTTKPGFPVHAIGTSHTARLAGHAPVIVEHSELDAARAEKRRRDRKVIPRSDAFKGKND